MADVPYAAVMVELLDRETGEQKSMTCYPVTMVRLVSANATQETWFTVSADGHWQNVIHGRTMTDGDTHG